MKNALLFSIITAYQSEVGIALFAVVDVLMRS